jgi:hypothetical protein
MDICEDGMFNFITGLCGESNLPKRNIYIISDDDEEKRTISFLERAMPRLIENIQTSSPRSVANFNGKKDALDELYELSNIKSNRVPMICTTKWELIPALANCITHLDSYKYQADGGSRRIACQTLNNLSIPFENQNMMIHGPHSSLLLEKLTHVIQSRLPESYLCCLCLMNLSSFPDAPEIILTFTPMSEKERNRTPQRRKNNSIDAREWDDFANLNRTSIRNPTPPRQMRSDLDVTWNSNFLLKCVENLMKEHRSFLLSRLLSVEGEAIRWSIGLLRNLSKTRRHCTILSKTEIPSLIVSFIEKSPHQPIGWNKDSLEEMCFTVLLNLSQFQESRQVLIELQTYQVLENLVQGVNGQLPLGLNDNLHEILSLLKQ